MNEQDAFSFEPGTSRADILSRVTTDFQELESELRIPGGGDFSTHVVS